MKQYLLCLAAVVGALAAAFPGSVSAGGAATPERQLLARYQPVTQFDPLERFQPTKVQSFVSDADLEQLVTGNWSLIDADPDPGELPGPGTGTWRLNRDVYSYQYPPSDFIWQAHEGDWEVVNVVLSEEEQPLFVGYSQHCLGQRRDWIDTTRVDGTHPIVHVALGSHANYFSAGVQPINPLCVPPAALAILAQLKLPPPSDYAFPGETSGPPAADGGVTPIHRIDGDHPTWTDFPGTWGELQYFHGPGPIGTIPFETSPQGPTYHAVWADPLGTLAAWPAG